MFDGIVQEGRRVVVVAAGWAEAFNTAARAGRRASVSREWRHVGWNPHPHSWVKLNTNSAVKGSQFKVSLSGVLRGPSGEWLGG